MARAPYFTEAECVIIMQGYEEFKSTIQGKSNTSAANKSRQACWQRIADRVNASSNTAQRTWQQVRMKYKNIMTSANKKKLSIKATGGGPPPEAFSRAEELAVANNVGRPTMEGVEGGVQSDPGASDMCTLYVQVEGGNMQVLQPPAEPSTSCDPQVQEDLGEDTLSALSDTHIQETFQQPPSPPVASSTRTSHTESALLLCL
ncbi:uncharacterized protein [Paramormyrops kingsleyae]|uniref:uncharacterized protein isoform X2 n=1 Tax=Paramormyrops kingsleyae TaxID=1676925 RepID=UPI003B978D57